MESGGIITPKEQRGIFVVTCPVFNLIICIIYLIRADANKGIRQC